MTSILRRLQKTTPIGLDIGDCGTRAVQLTCTGDSFHVRHAARAERWTAPQEGTPQPGRDTAQAEARGSSQISTCLTQADFRGRLVATALSPPDIEFHSIELPKASAAELVKVVEFEVKRLFTRNDVRVQTGHWTLPQTQGSTLNAVGVVAPYDKVVETVELCRGEGLRCSRVDTNASTLSRFGDLLNAWSSKEIWGVLDLGHRQSRLILCLEGVPILVRTVGGGGEVWTQRIAEGLGTTAKTAEVQKRDHGIASSGRRSNPSARRSETRSGNGNGSPTSEETSRSGASTECDTIVSTMTTGVGHPYNEDCSRSSGGRGELASVLLGILRSDLNELGAEVKRSYEYVLSCYPSRHAADLILVGGGAAMRNLPEYLTDALGIPVHRASAYLDNSSCRLRYNANSQNTLEMVGLAIGLAIGG